MVLGPVALCDTLHIPKTSTTVKKSLISNFVHGSVDYFSASSRDTKIPINPPRKAFVVAGSPKGEEG
jgi:hypothetical protein